MVTHALDLLYYTLAKMAVICKTIVAIISEFMAKAINNENKYL